MALSNDVLVQIYFLEFLIEVRGASNMSKIIKDK